MLLYIIALPLPVPLSSHRSTSLYTCACVDRVAQKQLYSVCEIQFILVLLRPTLYVHTFVCIHIHICTYTHLYLYIFICVVLQRWLHTGLLRVFYIQRSFLFIHILLHSIVRLLHTLFNHLTSIIRQLCCPALNYHKQLGERICSCIFVFIHNCFLREGKRSRNGIARPEGVHGVKAVLIQFCSLLCRMVVHITTGTLSLPIRLQAGRESPGSVDCASWRQL